MGRTKITCMPDYVAGSSVWICVTTQKPQCYLRLSFRASACCRACMCHLAYVNGHATGFIRLHMMHICLPGREMGAVRIKLVPHKHEMKRVLTY